MRTFVRLLSLNFNPVHFSWLVLNPWRHQEKSALNFQHFPAELIWRRKDPTGRPVTAAALMHLPTLELENFTLNEVSDRAFLYQWHAGCSPVECSAYLSSPHHLWPSVGWCKNQRTRGIPGGFLRLFPRLCAHSPILVMFLCLYKHGSSGLSVILSVFDEFSNVTWGTEAFLARPHKLLSHFSARTLTHQVSKQLFMTG